MLKETLVHGILAQLVCHRKVCDPHANSGNFYTVLPLPLSCSVPAAQTLTRSSAHVEVPERKLGEGTGHGQRIGLRPQRHEDAIGISTCQRHMRPLSVGTSQKSPCASKAHGRDIDELVHQACRFFPNLPISTEVEVTETRLVKLTKLLKRRHGPCKRCEGVFQDVGT